MRESKQAQHTPGPWEVKYPSRNNKFRFGIHHESENLSRYVAGVSRQADARLIAAAPDLLEAAEVLLSHHRVANLDGTSDTLQPRIDRLRAAIASAKKVQA
jgi:hypothetical protein